ncbi:MAG TPA: hypothetical protein VGD66_06745 [Allosphingosinicella sp.]|jgi:hypothetical protein
MLKPLLLGSAMLFAIPALAQTTSSSASTTNQTAVGSTSDGQDMTQSTADTGMRTGQTVQANAGACSQGASASAAGSANRRGARGSVASSCGTAQGGMSGMGQSGMGATAQGSTAGGSDWGSSGASGTASGTGTMATGSYTGQGGPDAGTRSYPPCTRTRTDNCRQRGGR